MKKLKKSAAKRKGPFAAHGERPSEAKAGGNWSAGLSIGGFKLGLGNTALATTGVTAATAPTGKALGDMHNAIRYTGRDLLGPIGDGANPGDVVFDLKLNPASMAVTRMAKIASLFQKFKFTRCSLNYVPSCPATTPGSLLGFVQMDVSQDPVAGGGATLLQIAASQYGAVSTNVYAPYSWALRNIDPALSYYVDAKQSPDERLGYQGRLIILDVEGNVASPGSMYIEYELELFIPQMGSSVTTGTGSLAECSTGVDYAHPFGTAPDVEPWSNIPIEPVDGKYLPLGQGCYLFSWSATGTGFTGTVPNWALTAGSIGEQWWEAQSDAKQVIGWFFMEITAADAPTASLYVDTLGTAPTMSQLDFGIAMLPWISTTMTKDQEMLKAIAKKLGLIHKTKVPAKGLCRKGGAVYNKPKASVFREVKERKETLDKRLDEVAEYTSAVDVSPVSILSRTSQIRGEPVSNKLAPVPLTRH